MPRATQMTRAQARSMYEVEGESLAAVGRRFGYSAATISKWAKQDGWVKPGSTLNPLDDTPIETRAVADLIPPPPPTETVVDSDATLKARVAELEAENARLEAENQKMKPTADIGDMLGDRVQWLTDNSPEGEQYWLNRAEAAFKADNMARAKDGLPVFNVSEHPEILDNLIVELKTKEMMAQSQEPTEPASRKVKLMFVRNGMPTIEQIPMESQINNMAGSLADGIIRYTRKGFKLTDPFLCPRAGCFRPAANDELGRWLYDGYCTDRHRVEVEGKEQAPTVGLQTKDTILSGIG